MSPRSKELSERMKARSRSAIIAAALELFAKKGFSGTTTEEIAGKAKVSKGLIFSHFSTKQGILLAILDEKLKGFLPRSDANDDARTPRERFDSLINAWMGLLENDPLLIRLSLRLNLDDGWRRILRRKGKQYMDLYLGRMRTMLVQLGSNDPDLDCYMIAVFFDGFAANYVAAPELFPLMDIKDHLMEILFSRWENRQGK